MEKITDFEMLPRFKSLKESGFLSVLQNCLAELLNCDVRLQCKLSTYQSKFNLFECPERTTYIEDEQTVSIVACVFNEKKLVSLMGVRVVGFAVCYIPSKIFDCIGKRLTALLSRVYAKRNNPLIYEAGETLIKEIITTFAAKGKYNVDYIKFLIAYAIKIKSLTFEGANIQTGMILTKAFHSFNGKNIVGDKNRGGLISKNDNLLNLIRNDEINKRLWYIADGKTSFFLFSKKLESSCLYVLQHRDLPLKEYISQYLMTDTLSQMDILIRIVNPNYLSVVANDVEFVNLEGAWHVRDYNALIKKLVNLLTMEEDVLKTIFFFVIQLSQKCKSSIIFIPEEDSDYKSDLSYDGLNILGEINVSDKTYTNTLFNIFTSDGVSIISKKGLLLKHGVIVKQRELTSHGKLLGTGQMACRILGEKGSSIKVSSDGKITIYNKKHNIELKF
ncbi:MAG: hypothetical protein IKR34_08025 [Candidatus Gastranaerophilales bacterium]|nr:hypothetical protein [Candidatus Gastranaerophilales bacterium]